MRAVAGSQHGASPRRTPAALLILRVIMSVGVTLALLAPAQVARAADATPITPGTEFSISLADYGDEASYSFSGSAGQRVTLSTDLPSCCTNVDVSLRSTDGEQIGSDRIGQFGEFQVALPSSGPWILVVANASFGPISVRATLGLVTDQTGILALGRQTVSTFSSPGTDARLTFAGTQGDKLALSVDTLGLSSTRSEPGAELRFLRPDGSELSALSTYSGRRFVKVLLDATGTWTLVVDPVSDVIGSIAFTVNRTVDQVVPASFGTPVTVTLTGGGQDVQVRLPATSAQRLVVQRLSSDLSAAHGRADPPSVSTSILRTSDSSIVGTPVGSGTYIESEDLPGSGTYAVLLEPYDDTVGTVQLKITAVSDQVVATAIGATVPVRVTEPGQNLRYSFGATAGQTLVAALDDLSLSAGSAGGDAGGADFTATLIAPDGQPMDRLMYGPVTYAERLNLPSTGVYQLEIDLAADTVGTAALSLRQPTVTTSRLALNRSTTAVFGRGDSARYTFAGATGQRLGVQVTAADLSSQPQGAQGVSFRLTGPGGADVYTSDPISTPRFIEFPVLSGPGTWTVVADPSGSTSGRVTFTVRPIVDQVLPITLGQRVTTRITVPGQSVIYRFQGRADMRVAVDTVSSAWTNPSPFPEDVAVSVFLSGPNGEYRSIGAGTPYPDATSATTWAETYPARLGSTGTWTLVIQPRNGTVGTKTFTLRRLDDISGSITLGRPKTVRLLAKGAWATYSFSFAGTGTLTWSASGSTIPSGWVQLIDPSGSIYREDYLGAGTSSVSTTFRGDPSGKWSIRVLAGIGQTGTTTLTLTRTA